MQRSGQPFYEVRITPAMIEVGKNFNELEKLGIPVAPMLTKIFSELSSFVLNSWTKNDIYNFGESAKKDLQQCYKMEEVIYVMQLIKDGKVSKYFGGNISYQQIMRWFDEYFENRCNLIDAEEHTRKVQELSFGPERSTERERGASLKYFAEKGLKLKMEVDEEKIKADAEKIMDEVNRRSG